MSHIINNDDFDDTNGDFIRNLYFSLKLLSSESFNIRAQPKLALPSDSELDEKSSDILLDMKFRLREDTFDALIGKSNSKNSSKENNFLLQNKEIAENYNKVKKETIQNHMTHLNSIVKEIDTTQKMIVEGIQKNGQQTDEISLRLRLQELMKVRADILAKKEIMAEMKQN